MLSTADIISDLLLGPLHILTAYLLGSVCFGLVFARRRGVDLRAVGSGNIGATNVARALGPNVGRVVMSLDMAKGALPVASALWLFGLDVVWVGATACAATLGHIFPLWFGFRGGKGAATAGGALLSAVPLAGLLSFLSFLIAKRASGHASVGSLTACIVAPLATWWTHASLPWVAVVLTLVTLVVVRHHSNISRLLRKEELDV